MTRTLFHSLGVPFNESQSAFHIASLHAALGDRYPAIAAFEEALSTQQTALARYPSLEAHIRRCSLEIDLRLYRLYESAVDPDGIGRIVERLERQFGSAPPDGLALLSSAGLSEPCSPGRTPGTVAKRSTRPWILR
jgi:hypothetical protein